MFLASTKTASSGWMKELIKGPVARDCPVEVTGGYDSPRGIPWAALVSKHGFLPISPSTVSEQV